MELQYLILKFLYQFDETYAADFKADTVFTNLDEWSSLPLSQS